MVKKSKGPSQGSLKHLKALHSMSDEDSRQNTLNDLNPVYSFEAGKSKVLSKKHPAKR